MLTGRASEAGTRRYAARMSSVPADHYRLLPSVALLSSLGIGTYLGQADPATDALYRRSVARALERRLNLVAAAINYRHQRWESAPRSSA